MSLKDWQDRLHGHYSDLAGTRRAGGHELPIFALEHGLTREETGELELEIRASVLKGRLSDAYYLPWIAYATEIGYRYDGAEYWPTFQDQTPRWIDLGGKKREWLRDLFVRFHKQYRGLKPKGTWATQFTIIAWPIQHAILPAYLQRHLARLLYDNRYELTSDLLHDPEALGTFLHTASLTSVKRLEDFCTEHELVGTIAAALLMHGSAQESSALSPQTLKRLIADLEREQRARNWLREAQRQATTISLQGLTKRATSGSGPSQNHVLSKPVRELAPEIEPRPLLLPKESGGWFTALEIPDFRPLLRRVPQLSASLATSRCIVFGTGRRVQAPGWLLSGPHTVQLTQWPTAEQVLIQLQPANPEVEHLFRSSCLLRPGNTYLFKLGSDGTAAEVRLKVVRPGERYVLVGPTGGLSLGPNAKKVAIHCPGLDAIQLDLPGHLNSAAQSYCEQLGLNPWQTVTVYPAGLCPAAWDGAGWAEWLTTDEPTIGVVADGPVSGYALELDQGIPFMIRSTTTEPVFCRLDGLLPGDHTLKVTTRGRTSNQAEQVGYLHFSVRAPKVRKSGYRSLFRVVTDPPTPSFDDLWNNTLHLEVLGPAGRNVVPTISLSDKDSDTALASKALPPMQMPVSAEQWREYFEANAIAASTLSDHTGEAARCILHFDAGELGVLRVSCEHELRPLRWVVEREKSGSVVRLVNEEYEPEEITVEFSSYETPASQKVLSPCDFYKGVPTSSIQGLVVARGPECEAGIITPLPERLGLGQLKLTPIVSTQGSRTERFLILLKCFENWSRARIPQHPVVFSHRQVVLRSLHNAMYDALYDEAKLCHRAQSPQVITAHDTAKVLASLSGWRAAQRTKELRSQFPSLSVPQRIEKYASTVFTEIWHSDFAFGPDRTSSARWLTEFLFRMATAPETLRRWAGPYFDGAVPFIIKHNGYAKTTRVLALALDGDLGPHRLGDTVLYRGWQWA
jgi:hypothetical protein